MKPPGAVAKRYAAWRWSRVEQPWTDTATWRLEHAEGWRRYLKVAICDRHPSLLAERERLAWVRPFLPVPAVVEHGSDGAVEWLVTIALPGRDATVHPLRDRPEAIVEALGRALARFHAAAPVGRCPFDFRLATAIDHVRARIESGRVDPARHFHPEHARLGVEEALALLERSRPAEEHLVVCHGDFCAPNVVFDDAGSLSGFVDLGELGVADRFWDLAVGAWSVTWNFGVQHEQRFYRAYGAPPDPQRIAFYRLLYDLVS